MDEIIPKLWIGDLPSALDVPTLKANGIYSILSAMRGRVTINETFIRHQILLDDTDDADILVHFLPSIAFIQAELDKGRGVLVHCQAGSSRSATIVAAYLMYSQDMDCDAALDLIRTARPCIEPNGGFMAQLAIFQQAAFKISRRDKSTRMFYMERAVCEVINGDGTMPETAMFAKYPHTPPDSGPTTPGGPRRRIRCKMCRQDLATREHLLDHGELGPATPEFSRRPSGSSFGGGTGRRPSVLLRGALGRGLGESLAMSALDAGVSALDSEDEDDVDGDGGRKVGVARPGAVSAKSAEAHRLGRRMSDAVVADGADDGNGTTTTMIATTNIMAESPTAYASATELAAQLYANPKLAGLRRASGSGGVGVGGVILANARCSGYFLEPMKWMEPFLQTGAMAGKIVCPNRKCGGKLGNYDWAGVCCGCGEWVTPGFCISRSKVDEVV